MSTATMSTETLDRILTRQILVAWAGERGEDARMGWWRTDLISEYGGRDLFEQLLPTTWSWAILQAAREAARRVDATHRSRNHDPDQLITLFSLGFTLDEHLDERLQDLKRSGKSPADALPGLTALLPADWSTEDALDLAWDETPFAAWVTAHGDIDPVTEPSGRRLKGAPPDDPERLTENLVAALAPLSGHYPMPYYRRSA